jgi:chromatin remodeling complex protein RSC6
MSTSVSTSKSNKMPAKKSTPEVKTPAPAVAAAPTQPAAKRPRKEITKEETPVVATTETTVAEPVRSAEQLLTDLQETLRVLTSDVSSRLRAAIHVAQDAVKALKRQARESKRRRRVDPATLSPEDRKVWEARRANNAFLKLRPISDELSSFMGLPAKSQKSQTDVTKFISTYVKGHNCFDPNFKRRIVPDAKLAKLLRVTDKDEVTYLNLQSFLKVHFLKSTPASA